MAAGNLVKEAFSPTIRYYGLQCPLQQSVEFNSNDFSVTKYRITRHVDACAHKRPPSQLAAVEISYFGHKILTLLYRSGSQSVFRGTRGIREQFPGDPWIHLCIGYYNDYFF